MAVVNKAKTVHNSAMEIYCFDIKINSGVKGEVSS
jgi:hypothetical protein